MKALSYVILKSGRKICLSTTYAFLKMKFYDDSNVMDLHDVNCNRIIIKKSAVDAIGSVY